jgi:hypothetical protein
MCQEYDRALAQLSRKLALPGVSLILTLVMCCAVNLPRVAFTPSYEYLARDWRGKPASPSEHRIRSDKPSCNAEVLKVTNTLPRNPPHISTLKVSFSQVIALALKEEREPSNNLETRVDLRVPCACSMVGVPRQRCRISPWPRSIYTHEPRRTHDYRAKQM